MIFNKKHRCI